MARPIAFSTSSVCPFSYGLEMRQIGTKENGKRRKSRGTVNGETRGRDQRTVNSPAAYEIDDRIFPWVVTRSSFSLILSSAWRGFSARRYFSMAGTKAGQLKGQHWRWLKPHCGLRGLTRSCLSGGVGGDCGTLTAMVDGTTASTSHLVELSKRDS